MLNSPIASPTFPPQGSPARRAKARVRACDVDKARGRIEIRRIAVRSKPPAYLGKEWPGLVRVAPLERTQETKVLCSRQVVYAIASILEQSMNAAQLLALAGSLWLIENQLFHVRDVTFMEDACRVGSGQAPQALAHIRDAALTLIRKRKLKPRPAREAFAANPKAAIRAIRKS